MTKHTKSFRFLLPLICLTGCSVVSANRVFPKLTWYWRWEAKVQRAERAHAAEWARTNHVQSAIKYPEYPLAEKAAKRDGTNFLGVYLGMIAELDGCTSVYKPKVNSKGEPIFGETGTMVPNSKPQGVMMFSATSGQLLRWISYEEFRAVYVLKTKPEYPR